MRLVHRKATFRFSSTMAISNCLFVSIGSIITRTGQCLTIFTKIVHPCYQKLCTLTFHFMCIGTYRLQHLKIISNGKHNNSWHNISFGVRNNIGGEAIFIFKLYIEQILGFNFKIPRTTVSFII